MVLIGIALAVFATTQCQPDDSPPPSVDPFSATPFDFEIPQGFPEPFIPSDNPMTVEGIKLGRHLFYEKRLSADLTMSCGSCHQQSNAFADFFSEKTSLGVNNTRGRRNAMPLFNLAWQEFFFWDGRARSLEEQSLHPIDDPQELGSDVPTVISRLEKDTAYPAMFAAAFGSEEINKDRLAKALAQFERSIVSYHSKFDSVARLNIGSFTPSQERGRQMFNGEVGDCFHCHGEIETQFLMGAFGKDNTFLNNGSDPTFSPDQGRMEVTGDPSDLGKFKVPSVRNVGQTFPFFHDGRIPDIDSLVEFYNFGGHPGPGNNIDPNMKAAGQGRNWSEQQKTDLANYLLTFTDFKFLSDSAYSDPFEK